MPSRSPSSRRIPGRAPPRIAPESRHRDIDLKPHEECMRRVRVVAQHANVHSRWKYCSTPNTRERATTMTKLIGLVDLSLTM
jgi:hypothetical protein